MSDKYFDPPSSFDDLEIKVSGPCEGKCKCEMGGCENKATVEFEVGPIKYSNGTIICLCSDHEDLVFEKYEDDLRKYA